MNYYPFGREHVVAATSASGMGEQSNPSSHPGRVRGKESGNGSGIPLAWQRGAVEGASKIVTSLRQRLGKQIAERLNRFSQMRNTPFSLHQEESDEQLSDENGGNADEKLGVARLVPCQNHGQQGPNRASKHCQQNQRCLADTPPVSLGPTLVVNIDKKRQ